LADKATYSASADDIAVQSYFFDIQQTNLSPRNCIPQEVLLRVSMHPAWLASKKAVRPKLEPFGYQSPILMELSWRMLMELQGIILAYVDGVTRGYKYHPLHVISYPLDQIQTDLSYAEEPEAILDRQDRVMRKKTIPFVKILWRNHLEREATWEIEESIRTSYPYFLP
nr:hypothetical protein [Tanacetum cinerariifolium]